MQPEKKRGGSQGTEKSPFRIHSSKKKCCCGGHSLRDHKKSYKGKQYEKKFQRGGKFMKVKG